MTCKVRLVLLMALGLAAMTAEAPAQTFPSRPITVVVPFPASGPSDTLVRIMGEHMRGALGQPIVVENVPGASGSIAAGRGARTLLDQAVTIPSPGWARSVEGFGWPAAEVRDVGSFSAALDAWRPDEGPLFIEAVFDPAAYEVMTRDLR